VFREVYPEPGRRASPNISSNFVFDVLKQYNPGPGSWIPGESFLQTYSAGVSSGTSERSYLADHQRLKSVLIMV
jgi:hypothetical protein